MKCPNCGKELANDACFCSKCGTKLSFEPNFVMREAETVSVTYEESKPAAQAADSTNYCSVCGQNTASRNLLDGYVCQSCMNKTFNHSVRWGKMTVSMVKDSIEMQKIMDRRRDNFSVTDGVGSKFEIDRNNRLARVNGKIYLGWEEIVDFSTIDNGKEISRGGWGGMLVGKAFGGNTGAIIGHSAKQKGVRTVTQLTVKIVTSNPAYPQVQIDMVGFGNVKTDTHAYKRISANTEKILSLLTIITDSAKNEEAAASRPVAEMVHEQKSTAADEIMKYKILLDRGAITQAEYDKKKNELLGM